MRQNAKADLNIQVLLNNVNRLFSFESNKIRLNGNRRMNRGEDRLEMREENHRNMNRWLEISEESRGVIEDSNIITTRITSDFANERSNQGQVEYQAENRNPCKEANRSGEETTEE